MMPCLLKLVTEYWASVDHQVPSMALFTKTELSSSQGLSFHAVISDSISLLDVNQQVSDSH